MDGFTLSLASAFISLVMVVSLSSLWLLHPRQLFLLDWISAGSLFLLSSVFTLMAFCQLLPEWLAPVLVNVTYLCAHAAILAGIRRQLHQVAHWDYIAMLALVIVFLHTTPFVQSALGHRIVVFYPLLMLINALIIWQLLQMATTELKTAYWPLLIAEVLFFIQLVVRFALMANSEPALATMAASSWVSSSGTLALLVFLLFVTVGCVLVVMRNQEISLKRASHVDQLTQCYNRRALDEMVPSAFANAQQVVKPLSMVMFDVDHFKVVNDRFGHQFGDIVLQQVASIAAQELRGYDQLFRIGGEEFLAVLADVNAPQVQVIAERVRATVQQHQFAYNGQSFHISISIGIAHFAKADNNWQAMFHRADSALYVAKAQGRNQICVDEPTRGVAAIAP